MKNNSFSLLATLAAIGILLSSTPAPAEPPRLGGFADASTAFSYQYVKETMLEPCSWTDRPTPDSQCFTLDSAGMDPIACDSPTSPRPTRPLFKFTPSAPCSGCSSQKWLWSDGRMLSGLRQGGILCPSDPSYWGPHGFTLFLQTPRSGHVFMQIPAFFVHQAPKTVRGQVKMRVFSNRPWEPANLPYRPMTAILALQSLGANGQWTDLATQVIATVEQHTTTYVLHEVQATIQPFTQVRLELRAGSVPAPVTNDDSQSYRNYLLEVDIWSASVLLPDCIPDESTGGCL